MRIVDNNFNNDTPTPQGSMKEITIKIKEDNNTLKPMTMLPSNPMEIFPTIKHINNKRYSHIAQSMDSKG